MKVFEQSIEALKKKFDQLAPTYDLETSTLAHVVNEYVNTQNILEILSHARAQNILDAGGGTGKLAIPLSQMGYRVTLIDISKECLNIARQKALEKHVAIETIEANAEQTSFESASFDFIIMQGVLCYTPNPTKMISEMTRLLIPKGNVWIEFNNSLGWALENEDVEFKTETALSEEKVFQMADWNYPVRAYSIKRMTDICNENHLRVEKTYGNHILLNSLPINHIYSHQYDIRELENIKSIELCLSKDASCIGASKTCQIHAIKNER